MKLAIMFLLLITSSIAMAKDICNIEQLEIREQVMNISSDFLEHENSFTQLLLYQFYINGLIKANFDCPLCKKIKRTRPFEQKLLNELFYTNNIVTISGYKNWNEFIISNHEKIKRMISKETFRIKKHNRKNINLHKSFTEKIVQFDDQMLKIYAELLYTTLYKKSLQFDLPYDTKIIDVEKKIMKNVILISLSISKDEYHLTVLESGNIVKYNTSRENPTIVPAIIKLKQKYLILDNLKKYCNRKKKESKLILKLSKNKEKYQMISKRWGNSKIENFLMNTLLYTPKLILNNLETIFLGTTSNRIAAIGKAIYNYAQGKFDKGHKNLGSSILNPLGTANALISDVATIAFSPIFALNKKSTRIKVCTSPLVASTSLDNLTPIGALDLTTYSLDPSFHVGIMIDMYKETSDSGGVGLLRRGLTNDIAICKSVSLDQQVSETLAVTKLKCMDYFYRPKYNIVTYNCGGYTNDLLKSSYAEMPDFPNLGIGMNIKYNQESHDLEDKKILCDNFISNLKNIFLKLEIGIDITDHELELFKTNTIKLMDFNIFNDPLVQLITSTIRGNNLENYSKVKIFYQKQYSTFGIDKDDFVEVSDDFETSLRFVKNDNFTKSQMFDNFLTYFEGFTEEDFDNLDADFPYLFELYKLASRNQ